MPFEILPKLKSTESAAITAVSVTANMLLLAPFTKLSVSDEIVFDEPTT